VHAVDKHDAKWAALLEFPTISYRATISGPSQGFKIMSINSMIVICLLPSTDLT
jgi:hypothetical protein